MSMSLGKSRREEAIMEVKEVLHMSRGDGDNSYAKHSTYQNKVTLAMKPVIARAVGSLFGEEPTIFPSNLLNVADLGCAAGPSTFTFMSTVIESVGKNCIGLASLPDIQFYLNDLPGNDFNTLFKGLLDFQRDNQGGSSFFVMAAPGSFHGRIFPRNSMHLIHSSYSVHWLSRVPRLTTKDGLPLNKGKIYISETSPPEVKEAYLAQFQEDFVNFLRYRSEEMVNGARLVLVFNGRRSADPVSKDGCYPWEPLGQAIASLVSEGLIEKEKLDALNLPMYISSQEEVQQLVQQQGSFAVDHIDTHVLDSRVVAPTEEDPWALGKKLAKQVRSITEPIIKHHLGEEVMDKLYDDKLASLMGDDLVKDPVLLAFNIVLVLRKLQA